MNFSDASCKVFSSLTISKLQFTLISVALLTSFTQISSIAAESTATVIPKEIKTDDLPKWTGKSSDLIAISIKKQGEGKVYLSSWHSGASYDDSGIMSSFSLYNTDSRPIEKIRPKSNLLPTFWQVGPKTEITYVVPKFRNELIFSLLNDKSKKEASILIQSVRDGVVTYNPSINGAIRVDNKYIAFKTNEYSFIFFDQQQGEFKNFGINATTRPIKEKCKGSRFDFVMTCGPDNATLFRAKDGTIVVDNPIRGDFRVVPL